MARSSAEAKVMGTTVVRRVLVVDDEPTSRRMIGRMLVSTHAVLEAASCEDALALLDRERGAVCVIVLDMSFPEGAMQGEQALVQIRDRWPDLAVIVITGAQYEVPIGLRCAQQGALSFLSKFDDLYRLLPRAIEKGELLSQFRRENNLLEKDLRRRRELERALAADADVPPESVPVITVDRVRPMAEVIREHYLFALRACGGNMSEAARRLEVPYESYRDRLIEWGFVAPRSRKS